LSETGKSGGQRRDVKLTRSLDRWRYGRHGPGRIQAANGARSLYRTRRHCLRARWLVVKAVSKK